MTSKPENALPGTGTIEEHETAARPMAVNEQADATGLPDDSECVPSAQASAPEPNEELPQSEELPLAAGHPAFPRKPPPSVEASRSLGRAS